MDWDSDSDLELDSDGEDDNEDDDSEKEADTPRQPKARLEDLQIAQEFQDAVRNATLENSGLDDDYIHRLRNPPTAPVDLSDKDLRLSLDLFLSTLNASEETFEQVRDSVMRSHPDDVLLTLPEVKKTLAEITGVVPLKNDMCHNSCVAYTGPFSELDQCPECSHPRIHPETGKTREFYTMPLGPQIQALFRDPETARLMEYRGEETERVLQELAANDGVLKDYRDVFSGSDYLDAKDDVLYRNKKSDCWISIWIIADIPPDQRYKKLYVVPNFIIGGPNKPKNMDSFSLPSKEGLRVWNSLSDKTADGPGLTTINGFLGHGAFHGCRENCLMPCRHKPNKPMHYPAMKKPRNYDIPNCNHPDIDPRDIKTRTEAEYHTELTELLQSQTPAATGISKPSIFDGLPRRHRLAVTGLFPSDLMHWASLNWTELMLGLFRGTLDCQAPDSKQNWPWMKLVGDVWEEHGQSVEDATPHLPGSFDRPPRNPATKISSGYKAWEYLLYVIGLAPALLHSILPPKYWEHFCIGIRIIRIFHQRRIPVEQLVEAHQLALKYVEDFEDLYYDRMPERLHFVRQSVHRMIHLAREVVRLGPQTYYSQWTMERTIGNLGEEIKQPSNPYANLSERALLRAQVNALYAMCPQLNVKAQKAQKLPRYSIDVGRDYVLLRRRDRYAVRIEGAMAEGICEQVGLPKGKIKLKRWARLRLPNGQIARSQFGERGTSKRNLRSARIVKFLPPDADFLRRSHGTVWTSKGPLGPVLCFHVSQIVSVVAMVPWTVDGVDAFFLVEKPGLELASMSGFQEKDTGSDDLEAGDDGGAGEAGDDG
ncbi:hypothetical protein C8F01DRAFT_1209920 [Mycena amicta]|nr:hypothetical protein C8F01DRAFT_1209920 [Mycena amicta]